MISNRIARDEVAIKQQTSRDKQTQADNGFVSLIVALLCRFSVRVTFLTVLLCAVFIYAINHPRMLQGLPFLALTMIVLIEWLITRPLETLNKNLVDLIDRDELTSQSLKAINTGLSPELKTILNPLYLTVSKIENEKLQNQEKSKDLQRWKAQKVEEQDLERQTLTTFSGLTDSIDLSSEGDRLAGVSKSFEALALDVLDALQANGGDEIKAAVFMRAREQGKYSVAASLHLTTEQQQSLQKIFANTNNPVRAISGVAVDIGPLSMKRYNLDEFSESVRFNHAIVFPIENEGRKMGQVICFAAKEAAFRPEQLRQIEKFCHQLAPTFYRLELIDIERERQNTDLLTGLRSRHYLNTLLNNTALSNHNCAPGTRPVLLVTGLDLHQPQFADVSEDTIEKWLPQLATMVNESLYELPQSNNQGEIHVCRFQSNLIAVLIEQARQDYIEALTASLPARIASRPWAGLSGQMSASIGLCVYSDDAGMSGSNGVINSAGGITSSANGNNASELDNDSGASTSGAALISKALRALYYAQERLGPGKSAWASQVPPDFQPQRYAVIDGELGVLDGFSLLQSIAASSKTGVLTVRSQIGDTFVTAWDNGKLTHAKSGQAVGLDAISEFVIFQTTGHFHFQQMQELPTIDEPGTRTPNLGQALMAASIAADHYESAHKAIPYIATTISRSATNTSAETQYWQDLSKDEEISSREQGAIKDLYAVLPSTPTPMSAIFKLMEQARPELHYPLSLKWRAAYLLLKYNLLKTD